MRPLVVFRGRYLVIPVRFAKRVFDPSKRIGYPIRKVFYLLRKNVSSCEEKLSIAMLWELYFRITVMTTFLENITNGCY